VFVKHNFDDNPRKVLFERPGHFNLPMSVSCRRPMICMQSKGVSNSPGL
jgi:hypothetical protein